MSDWTAADLRPGDTAHIALDHDTTRPCTVSEPHPQTLEIRDPRTGITEQRTYGQVAGRTRSRITDDAPPGDGPWPRYGDYWSELGRSQLAGTATTCPCGCLNPALWDACQECQRPIPDPAT